MDRALEGAASLAGPGDSRPEPLLPDGNAAGAALQPDLPDAETQAEPRALPLDLVPLASTRDSFATPLVGPGSGDDPGEAPELQPDSPGASQPRTLTSDRHVAGGNAAVQEALQTERQQQETPGHQQKGNWNKVAFAMWKCAPTDRRAAVRAARRHLDSCSRHDAVSQEAQKIHAAAQRRLVVGSGSGDDPVEASELQPDSTGGSANSSASTCVRLSVPLGAEEIHAKMKRYWREFSDTAYNRDVLKQLSHVPVSYTHLTLPTKA